MALGWFASTLFPFVAFYAAATFLLRRGVRTRAAFEERRESVRRLRGFRTEWYIIVLVGTIGIAYLTGFGTSLSGLASRSPLLRALVPPYALRLAAIAYGPLLLGTLLVHDAVAPYIDSLSGRVTTRRESVWAFVVEYADRSVQVFGILVLVHWAPDGIVAAVTVAVATLAYVSLTPYYVRLREDVREPTPDERGTFEGVEGPHDATVSIVETAHPGDATGFVAGLVPGHREVFLSDVLVDALSDRELQAVLAHEYGHLRRHTMVRSASLKATCLGAGVLVLTGELRVDVGWGPLFDLALVGGLLLGIYVGGQRRLHREEEFEADQFAAEQVGPGHLAEALVRIIALRDPDETGDLRRLVVESRTTVEERVRRLRPELLWSTPPIPTRT